MTRAVVFACLLCLALVTPSSAQDAEAVRRFREHNDKATAAYQKKDWPAAIEGYKAAAAVIPHQSALYNLACCYALAGQPDEALGALERAVAAGFADKEHAKADSDLVSLRELPRFGEIIGKIKSLTDAKELLELEGDIQVPKVPWYVNLPDGHDPKQSYPVVLALPPGPGTAGMVYAGLSNYWAAEAKTRGYLVISIELVGPRFQGRAEKIVGPILQAAKAKYGADLDRVVLGGFSNGGIGSFIVLGETWKQRPFKALLALPGLAPDGVALDTLPGLEGFPMLLKVGEGDPRWVKGMEATLTALKAARAKVDYEVVPGQGHVLQLDGAKLYDWIDGVLAPKARKQE